MKTLSQMLAEPRDKRGSEELDTRPQSPAYLEATGKGGDSRLAAWCELDAAEQVRRVEASAFEDRLTKRAQRLADEGVPHDRLEAGLARARAARQAYRRAQARLERTDPPCKAWRAKVTDPELRRQLEAIWEASLRDWILRDPTLAYLASPSRKCECAKCDPEGFAMRKAARSHVDEFGPMEYPEAS